MTEAFHGWGVQRNEATTGKPFLLGHAFHNRSQAVEWILHNYGSAPSRKAALKRHRRSEGIRPVRITMRVHGGQGGPG